MALWGWQEFAVAIALFLILIGIFVVIYMLIVKPDGTLTVTYEIRAQQQMAASNAPPPASAPAPDATLATRLAQLDVAHRAGLISDQEYAAKRQEMLSGF